MHVLHIINSLDLGGAETALTTLVSQSNSNIRHTVVSLTGNGILSDRLRRQNIETIGLNFPGCNNFPFAMINLIRLIRKKRPNVIQTWMYHSDIIGTIAALASNCRIPVVWGVRLSEPFEAGLKRSTLAVIRLASILSKFSPKIIVANAEASLDSHVELGYPKNKFRIISNGIDVSRFKPNGEKRKKQRQALGIHEDEIVAGLIGRFSEQKNQIGFIKAAGDVIKSDEKLRILLCGRNISMENQLLSYAISNNLSQDRIILISEIEKIETIYCALDFYVSASLSEGFPNVIAEAMACGLPCIATDVGDCAKLIGNTGFVIPPNDTQALVSQIIALTGMPSESLGLLGVLARKKILEKYTVKRMTDGFEGVWHEMIDLHNTPPAQTT